LKATRLALGDRIKWTDSVVFDETNPTQIRNREHLRPGKNICFFVKNTPEKKVTKLEKFSQLYYKNFSRFLREKELLSKQFVIVELSDQDMGDRIEKKLKKFSLTLPGSVSGGSNCSVKRPPNTDIRLVSSCERSEASESMD
jgi:hypothetical protein